MLLGAAARSPCPLLFALGNLVSPFRDVASCVVDAERYQSVGEDGSKSVSERLRWCGLLEFCMCDSDVLRGLFPPIPKPAVRESLYSGKISPKSKPSSPTATGEGAETSGEAWDEEKCVMGSAALVLGGIAFLGLLIRLANDWEFVESWSSATYFAR